MWQDFSAGRGSGPATQTRDLNLRGRVAEGDKTTWLNNIDGKIQFHGRLCQNQNSPGMGDKGNPFTALGLHVGDMGQEGGAWFYLRQDVGALSPMVDRKIAKIPHFYGIMNAIMLGIDNGMAESINSKIRRNKPLRWRAGSGTPDASRNDDNVPLRRTRPLSRTYPHDSRKTILRLF